MSRIRTIKPEFPQSESIGRLSRDARLLFIQLWTLVDDAGRARAASRMLASLLYPYDDDAPGLISGWLGELEREKLIQVYDVDCSRYLQIVKWEKHQKIDRPSASRLPGPEEAREDSASPREDSRALDADLGPSTKDLGPSEANASGADEPRPDARTILFREGLASLRRTTGKTEGGCRKLIGQWLRDSDDDAVRVFRAIEDAERNRVSDAVAWITRALKPKARPPNQTRRDENRQNWSDALERLGEFATAPTGSDVRETPVRLLPAAGGGRSAGGAGGSG